MILAVAEAHRESMPMAVLYMLKSLSLRARRVESHSQVQNRMGSGQYLSYRPGSHSRLECGLSLAHDCQVHWREAVAMHLVTLPQKWWEETVVE